MTYAAEFFVQYVFHFKMFGCLLFDIKYIGMTICAVKPLHMRCMGKYSIYKDEKPLDFDKKLELNAEWSGISPAVFPHASHVQWLDCSNCHPDIFNIKKKTTKHFEMKYILDKKFCGVCHLSVALPIDDCKGCHPKMR